MSLCADCVVDLVPCSRLSEQALEQMGFVWHMDGDGEYIINERILQITQEEAAAYLQAGDRLYAMYEEAAEYVIAHKLYEALDIPQNLIALIEHSWKCERGNHLYGRFDVAGGMQGHPIKLIEFNADTPTLLFESAVVQTALLQYHDSNGQQCNNVYAAISSKLSTISKEKSILFSCVEGNMEEEMTTRLLQQMAEDSGVKTHFAYLDNIRFENEGIYSGLERYDMWFKLYPWEDIAIEHPEVIRSLGVTTMALNPAYTLLFQSKGMLKILYDLFPESPYLLKTSDKKLPYKCVQKPTFSREGANISIVDDEILYATQGEYDHYNVIYQEYVRLNQDREGNYYQCGIFYSVQACGIGFRRGGVILNNRSKFVAHQIK